MLECLICGKKLEGLNFYLDPKNTKRKICPECFNDKEWKRDNEEYYVMSEKTCKTCKKAIFVIGFEEDPFCSIHNGIECARKKTWCSWEFNNNIVIFRDGVCWNPYP